MRSLFLTTRQFWPLDTGGKLRDYHLARQLAAHSKLTYVGFRDGTETTPCPPEMAYLFDEMIFLDRPEPYTKATLIKGILGRQPANVINYTTREMSETLARLVNTKRFDTIQVESVFMSGYMKQLRHAPGNPRIVTDWHNIESELMARYATHIQNPAKRLYAHETARRLKFAESDQIKHSDTLLVPSGRERDALIASGVNIPIYVVENGVDAGQFENSGAHTVSTPDSIEPNIIFVGSMDYHANIDAVLAFATEMWPTIREANPDLTFKIVGRRPPAAVTALASIPGIEVTGSVPDVRPFYQNTIASVVPLRVGGGTRLKILEAFAARTPVISTSLGAEGLASRDGEHLLIAETASAFAQAISSLRNNRDLRDRITTAGHHLVKTTYDWPVVGRDLGRIHASLMAPRHAA